MATLADLFALYPQFATYLGYSLPSVGTTYDVPAAAAPAPYSASGSTSGSTSGGEGSPEKRAIKWAPDYSSYIFEDEAPAGTFWRDAIAPDAWNNDGMAAGWYTPGGMSDLGEYTPGQRVYAFDDARGENTFGPTHTGRDMPTYAELQAAGFGDWSDPVFRAHMTARAGGKDPFTDPAAMAEALMSLWQGSETDSLGIGYGYDTLARQNSGLTTGQYLGRQQGDFAYNELKSQGAPEEYAAAMRDGINQYQIDYEQARRKAEHDGFTLGGGAKDALASFGQILSLPPIQAMLAAMTLGGTSALAEGAKAGATAATDAAAAEALAAGIAPEAGALFSGLDAAALGGADLVGAGLEGAGMLGVGAAGAAAPAIGGGEVLNLFGPTSYMSQPSFLAAGGGEAALGATGVLPPHAIIPGDALGTMINLQELTGTNSFTEAAQVMGFDSADDLMRMLPDIAPDAFAAGAAATAEPGVFDQLQQSYEQAKPYVDKFQQVAKTVDSLTGGPAADAPVRSEGMDDAAYSQELILYMGLSPEQILAAGYEPGTREYYNYVLEQADSIIMQILGEVGDTADAEELSAALRTKSAAELQDLQRALYVRGQMGTLMGSGEYTDPFSGQEVDVLGSGMFNPGEGAYGAGLASDVDTLAQLGSTDPNAARAFLQELLGRNPDLYGMQARQDAALERAKLEGGERKRRGMFSF